MPCSRRFPPSTTQAVHAVLRVLYLGSLRTIAAGVGKWRHEERRRRCRIAMCEARLTLQLGVALGISNRQNREMAGTHAFKMGA